MMNQMNITSAKYIKDYDENFTPVGDNKAIWATIDGHLLQVPLDPANRHYSEILRQVEANTLIIQDAEPLTGNE